MHYENKNINYLNYCFDLADTSHALKNYQQSIGGIMSKILKVVAILTFVAVAAEARRDQGRENRQQARIAQGVKSGSLTKKEAKRLHQGQKHVDRMQNRAMKDGQMTAIEKVRIEKAQDRQNRQIYKQKHDRQNRKDKAMAPAAPAETSSGN